MCERFSYYGTTVVFVRTLYFRGVSGTDLRGQTNFIQQPLPPGSRTGAGGTDGQSGALDMGQQASTGLITFNNFWCALPILFLTSTIS